MPPKKPTPDFWIISTVLLAGLIGGYLVGNSESTATPQQPNDAPTAVAPEIVAQPPTVDDDAVLGEANAPVTLIEFSDYQCPFCRRFFELTLPEIKKNYIDTGKAKLVFRDFPLPFHASAIPAAQAAECANEQNQFWAMHDKLFEKQGEQGGGTIQFGADDLKTWAQELDGLNYADWETCFDSEKYTTEIEKDRADGVAAGVSGTPTVFVNGRMITGAQPYQVFAAAIEAALAEVK